MAHWSVPPAWKGEQVFILAGGPSLKGFDASLLAGRRVITINDSWELCPTADVLYFCDRKWWFMVRPGERQNHGSKVLDRFKGQWIVTLANQVPHPRVLHLRNAITERGVTADRSALVHGSNGGYQAINLAVHLGVSSIVLLGYDMRVVEPVDGDGTHWHVGHAGQIAKNFAVRCQKTFLPRMRQLETPLAKLGVEVLNATPGSAIDWWPRVDVESVLQCSSRS